MHLLVGEDILFLRELANVCDWPWSPLGARLREAPGITRDSNLRSGNPFLTRSCLTGQTYLTHFDSFSTYVFDKQNNQGGKKMFGRIPSTGCISQTLFVMTPLLLSEIKIKTQLKAEEGQVSDGDFERLSSL